MPSASCPRPAVTIEAAADEYFAAGAAIAGDLDNPDLVPWRAGAALALTRLRQHQEANELAQENLQLAQRSGSAYAVGQALRTVAATSFGDGRVDLLRQARATLEGARADRLAAQVDTDLAVLITLQGGAGTREEAVDAAPRRRGVRRHARTCSRCRTGSATCSSGSARSPRRIRSETLAKLTASEQRAARMAASGLTNREIAAEMTVTIKAVEWHLSHVYRKLGIPNRTELADTLGAAV